MNQSLQRSLLTVAAMGLSAGIAPVARAQQLPADRPPVVIESPSGARQAEAKEEFAMGQLVRVDVKNQSLTLRDPGGSEMVFKFTPQTKITGAIGGAAGLATQEGNEVTVYYTKQGSDNVASAIEVSKKQG